MKKNSMLRKALVFLCGALLLVSVTVTATLAYLTDNESVTNTFTVGNVGISLDESPVDEDGKTKEGARVQANAYKLIPGRTYDKDPIVHVDEKSENCWLFVEIVNEIAPIEDASKSIAGQMTDMGWLPITKNSNIYAYKESVPGGTDVPVFKTFTIAGEGVTNDILAAYEGKTVKVTAYAIQAAGFDTSADAWAAYSQQHPTPAP